MIDAPRTALLAQLRRGTLEYCVLALLHGGERYGLELVRQLGQVDGMMTSEGTVYPLLGRLRRDGLVATTWRESPSGPPRRYYHLTPTGQQALDAFAKEWARFRDAVDHFLDTGGHHTAMSPGALLGLYTPMTPDGQEQAWARSSTR